MQYLPPLLLLKIIFTKNLVLECVRLVYSTSFPAELCDMVGCVLSVPGAGYIYLAVSIFIIKTHLRPQTRLGLGARFPSIIYQPAEISPGRQTTRIMLHSYTATRHHSTAEKYYASTRGGTDSRAARGGPGLID